MILILGGAEAMATLGRGMVVMITLEQVAMTTLGRGVVMMTRVAEAMVSPEDAVVSERVKRGGELWWIQRIIVPILRIIIYDLAIAWFLFTEGNVSS